MPAVATPPSMIVLVFGVLVLLAIVTQAGLRRLSVPPLVGFFLLGIALRGVDDRLSLLGDDGRAMVHFLAQVGLIVLLFRVGLESKLKELVSHLGSSSVIWAGNVLFSAAAGFGIARWGLGQDDVPSLVVASAMTATSVSIPAAVWRDADKLNSEQGERFLDVAELDDMSGVLFMAVLFAVLRTMAEHSGSGLLGVVGRNLGWFALKFGAFIAGCLLFSCYLERHYTDMFRRFHSERVTMLVVVATGLVVAAMAGLLGFSVAVGAFLAGLAFSRDPKSVRIDTSFDSIHGLFSPFFFIGVGMRIDPGVFTEAWRPGLLLLIAAAAGKFIGTSLPALAFGGAREAAALGVSMIPRAEIALVIMQQGRQYGPGVVGESTYAGMVIVSAVTCMAAPAGLSWLLSRQQDE